ncbi:MAG: hypothetical protein JW819_03930 [Candidatus Krumholzibacteriota bacterium]|nr:hypothetical protein [Candidatus Krumholzibacteriota bacterium]
MTPRPARRFRRRVLRWLAPLLMLAVACVPYASKVSKVRTDLANGDPAAALARLEKMGGDGLPELMERGLLQYLTGDLPGCQETFARAQQVVQDLYTQSLTREAARLLINDTMQAYRGEVFERVWIHYYRALGYLAAGQPHEAAVEGRAVTADLQYYADTGADEAKYKNDPFLQYFAGLLYEADGELNDAWINYRQAERLYQAADIYGVPGPPAPLVADLLRAGRALRFDEEAAAYEERYAGVEVPAREAGEGDLVVLVEARLVPAKLNNRMDFPIFGDADDDNDDAAWVLAEDSYNIWRRGEQREVKYWLTIALPAVDEPEPAPGGMCWRAGGRRGDLALAADLGALSRQCLADRYPAVVVRTVARALLKYWAKEKTEEEQGKAAGFLVDILGSATEMADTRSWSTLPGYVLIGRGRLPAGEHVLTVQGGGLSGQATVTIAPGKMNFVALRLF